jgi:glyoxylase-like metal-dependent hydrolase (beta-lactamase superfamily II)
MNQPFCVYKDVYQVGGSDISHPADCAVYLINCGDLVLIDTGAGPSFERLVDNIKTLGFNPEKLKAVIATHRHIDHIGSLWQFQQKFGAQIIAHGQDADGIEKGLNTAAELYGIEYQPCTIDIKINRAEASFEYGTHNLNVIHIPGHTVGGIAIYIDMEKRVLFGQDIHGPYSLPGASKTKAKQSLQKLIDLAADILCEGHFGIYKSKEGVRAYINSYLLRL